MAAAANQKAADRTVRRCGVEQPEVRCRPCAGITQIRFGGLAGDRPTSQRYRAPLATVDV